MKYRWENQGFIWLLWKDIRETQMLICKLKCSLIQCFLWFHFCVSFICDHRTILMFRIILRFERKILHLGDLCAEWICKTESVIFLKGKRVPSVPYRQNGFKVMFWNHKELKMYLLYSFILMLFLLFSRLLMLFINNVLPYLKKNNEVDFG